VAPFDVAARLRDRAACSLLNVATGECSVYEVRPLACRKHHSLDEEACRAGLDDPDSDPHLPFNEALRGLHEMVDFALQTALARKGLDSGAVELTAALHRVLTQPDAINEWAKYGWSLVEPTFRRAAASLG
jgi:hypothetical protein